MRNVLKCNNEFEFAFAKQHQNGVIATTSYDWRRGLIPNYFGISCYYIIISDV